MSEQEVRESWKNDKKESAVFSRIQHIAVGINSNHIMGMGKCPDTKKADESDSPAFLYIQYNS